MGLGETAAGLGATAMVVGCEVRSFPVKIGGIREHVKNMLRKTSEIHTHTQNVRLSMDNNTFEEYCKKKFVDYKEGQELYSLGEALFRQIAHDADAIYRVKRRVLINTELVDEYMEVFHERKNS